KLVAAVLGDCVGGYFQSQYHTPITTYSHVVIISSLWFPLRYFTLRDDTAMTRCLVQSLLTRAGFDWAGFDEQDMASSHSAGQGYGAGVIQVLRKLESPYLNDLPARTGSVQRSWLIWEWWCNEVSGSISIAVLLYILSLFLSLAFCSQYSRLDATLTHSCSLCYNGAVLQALTVHLHLQGLWNCHISLLTNSFYRWRRWKEKILLTVTPECNYFLSHPDLQGCDERNSVSIEEIGFFLCLNCIAALHSVPTAMFCVLHCLEPRDCLTNRYVGLERTIWPWGGGTDTIACMPGAIAGSRYGIYTIPKSSRGAVWGFFSVYASFVPHRTYHWCAWPKSFIFMSSNKCKCLDFSKWQCHLD
uniref:ADP-ribosylhydrolase ARH3 n=1 Tax=Oncorhynchus mykiss TaxID=8022 RepID=A0A8C7TJM6_ONCMY